LPVPPRNGSQVSAAGFDDGVYSSRSMPAWANADAVCSPVMSFWMISVTTSLGLASSHLPIECSVATRGIAPARHTAWHSHSPGLGGLTRLINVGS